MTPGMSLGALPHVEAAAWSWSIGDRVYVCAEVHGVVSQGCTYSQNMWHQHFQRLSGRAGIQTQKWGRSCRNDFRAFPCLDLTTWQLRNTSLSFFLRGLTYYIHLNATLCFTFQFCQDSIYWYWMSTKRMPDDYGACTKEVQKIPWASLSLQVW